MGTFYGPKNVLIPEPALRCAFQSGLNGGATIIEYVNLFFFAPQVWVNNFLQKYKGYFSKN